MAIKLDYINLVIFIICLFWTLAVTLIAPYSVAPATIELGEEGKVGIPDNAVKLNSLNLNGFARALYGLGDLWCHQNSSRSLFVNGNVMPFCARDVGIFIGLAIGTGLSVFKRIELKWWWIIAGLAPIGIDGTMQLFTSYESTNPLRLITGGLAGLVTGLALGMIVFNIEDIYKGWKYCKYKP
jgi:uncharacterized membrane protein